MRLFLFLFVSLGFYAPVWGVESGVVAAVFNGKSLQLRSGDVIRLASVQVPNVKETTGQMRPGEPGGELSKQALEALVMGKTLHFTYPGQQQDRKGRWVAIAHLEEGAVVQEALLKQGMALVYPFPDTVQWLRDWQKLEAQARQQQKGIWSLPYWHIKPAESLLEVEKERFALVRGVVLQAAEVRGNWYLNFGEDWKTDFTARISKQDAKEYFSVQDLQELKGKNVLLRGWIYQYRGGAMDVHQPEQIEQQ